MFAVIIYRIQPGGAPQLFVNRIVSGFESESEADKWCDALEGEGNFNDRSLIVKLEHVYVTTARPTPPTAGAAPRRDGSA